MTTLQLIKEPISLPERYSITPEAMQSRGEIVVRAQTVTKITTREEYESATTIGRELQRRIKAVEETGLELRRPLSAAQDKVKALEDDCLAPCSSWTLSQINMAIWMSSLTTCSAWNYGCNTRK